MGLFDGQPDYNALPTAADGVSAGPQTGFMANFMAAVSEQYNARSATGAQSAMSTLEQDQLDKLYKLTGTRMSAVFPGAFYLPGVDKSGPYQQDIMHVMAGDTADYGPATAARMQQEYAQAAQKQIEQYDALAQQHGLLTYEQMFKQVQANAQQAVANSQEVQSRETGMGWLGAVVGDVRGSLTLRDPLNLATLAIGGVGKTFIARVAGQIGMNGLARAAELMNGSADTQKLLLGKGPTPEEEAIDIATAGLGAGVLHVGGEAAVTGLRALTRTFGRATPDVAAAALAHEADQAIGPSPYGTSRAAQGAHTGQVLDALQRDTPFELPGLASPPPALSPAALVGRESDQLFAGTSTPLANLFDKLPGDAAKIASANRMLSDLTARIGEMDKATAALDAQITARQASAVPAEDIFRNRAKVADLTTQIAGETDQRTLGQLNRDKAQAETALASGEAANANLQALADQRQSIGGMTDDLRLQRSRIVADLANGNGARKSAALGRVDPGLGTVSQASQTPTPSTADAIEREVDEAKARGFAPPEGTGPKMRILPPEPPKPVAEGAAPQQQQQPARAPAGQPGSGEMVELGQRSGAVDMDTMIPWGKDEDGNVQMASIRNILADLKSHDDLVQAMTECLL